MDNMSVTFLICQPLHAHLVSTKILRGIWYMHNFQCLNNITRIFRYFFTYTYFQKIQTRLLEQQYQMGPKFYKKRKHQINN